MSKTKEHYHDEIIAAQRETLVDDSGAEPDKDFFQLGEEFICVDHAKKEVFICRCTEQTTHLKLWRGELYVKDILTYKKLKKISKEEFAEHFNSIAEQMQNLTF